MHQQRLQRFGTRKERFHLYNHLTSLVKGLEGMNTIIDLRNESCVSGLIKNVDGLMNVEMESAVFYDQQGRVHRFDTFFVGARNIRYVHIPDGVSSLELIENQLSDLRSLNKTRPTQKKKPTLKSSRAKRYNAEILKELSELQYPQPGSSKM